MRVVGDDTLSDTLFGELSDWIKKKSDLATLFPQVIFTLKCSITFFTCHDA